MDIDVSDTCKAKSDQLNADDLVGGPITVSITNISKADSNEQPVLIAISGGYQCFKPCKTMRRALVAAWGKNAAEWIGRSMTLFRDPNVKWAGDAIGGIRISHLSHIQKPLDLSLSESKGKKKKIVIQPLKDIVSEWTGKLNGCTSLDQLLALGAQLSKTQLSDDERKTLLSVYNAKGRDLKKSPKPDATDLNAANDPVQAMRHTISNIRDDNDRANGLESIRDLFESGSIDQATCDELVAEANKKRGAA